ncbi:hypothetical protein [Stenotrophomonas pavanii]
MRLPASGRHYRSRVSPRESRQGIHCLFQPLQMQQVFRAVAEALG